MSKYRLTYRTLILIAIIGMGTLTNIMIVLMHQKSVIGYPDIEHQVNPTKTDAIHPFIEYEDICDGLNEIAKLYPSREIQGFFSEDNRLIVTAVGSIHKVIGPKPINYEGKYYLPWKKTPDPQFTYQHTIDYSGSDYLFIPVKTMFHTHVIDGSLSRMDLQTAKKLPRLKHLLINNEQIVDFNQFGPQNIIKNSEKICQLIFYRD